MSRAWAVRGVFGIAVGMLLVGASIVIFIASVGADGFGGDNALWLVATIVACAALGVFIIQRYRREGVLRPRTRKCPQCAESVKTEAKVCRHCGYGFAS